MVTYTTLDLITNIKRIAHFPEGNSTFQPSDLLALADLEMRTGVTPKIASIREDYWVTTIEYELNAENEYPIPSKSVGEALVDVKIAQNGTYIPLARFEIRDLYTDQWSSLAAYGFIVEDNLVKLMPPNVPGKVKMWYYRIPSKLVLPSACAQITDIDYVTGEVTVASLPSGFTSTTELDVSSQQPGFNVIMKDTLASINGNVLTFALVNPRVKVGDWVSLSGESCVVQCPLEWVEVLAQRVACKVYEIQGYQAKLAAAKKVLEEMEKNAMSLVSPRIAQKAKMILAGGSLLNTGVGGWALPVNRNNP